MHLVEPLLMTLLPFGFLFSLNLLLGMELLQCFWILVSHGCDGLFAQTLRVNRESATWNFPREL